MTLNTYDTYMTFDTAIATVDEHGLINAVHCEFHKVMLLTVHFPVSTILTR